MAYEATGAPPASQSFPEDGYASAADLFSKRTGSGTCNIKTAAPRLHRRLEDTKRVYPVQKGDIIFQTRWMFHQTVPFDQEFVRKQRKLGEQPLARASLNLHYIVYSLIPWLMRY